MRDSNTNWSARVGGTNETDGINCSYMIPTAEVFFQNLVVAEKAMIILSSLVVMATLAVFAEEVVYIMRRYTTSNRHKYKTVQVLSIYPGISLAALFSLYIPKSSVFCDQVIFVYISTIMYTLAALMLTYSGGKQKMVSLFTDCRIKLQTPPCCCCCFCFPTFPVNMKNVQRLTVLVLQNAIAQPVFAFISFALSLDNKYIVGMIELTNGFPYLMILSQTSFLLGLYGLFMLFEVCKDALKPVFISPKFFLLQLIIILTLLQGTIFSVFAKFNMPSCRGALSSFVRARAYFLMVLIFQLLLLSLLSRYFYRRPQSQKCVHLEITPNAEEHQNHDSSIYKLMGKGEDVEADRPL